MLSWLKKNKIHPPNQTKHLPLPNLFLLIEIMVCGGEGFVPVDIPYGVAQSSWLKSDLLAVFGAIKS